MVAVEGEVEVEAGLFAVGDDVESGGELVADGDGGGVVLQLGDVVRTELVEVGAGKQKPSGKGIAADDGGSERAGVHGGI